MGHLECVGRGTFSTVESYPSTQEDILSVVGALSNEVFASE